MSVRLRGTDAGIHIRWIPKYTTLERFLHWVHTASFIPLALTGFVLFAPFLELSLIHISEPTRPY